MNLLTARRALLLIDPVLVHADSLSQAKAVLGTVRNPSTVEVSVPSAEIVDRLRKHHRVGPLVELAWPELAKGDHAR